MAEPTRIEELRRRLQKEPASIAFAQLAEEFRRAGRFQEAVDTSRAGLKQHPGYISARVTLGRALLELGQLGPAELELNDVLKVAPQNLAAVRGLAEVFRRRGELREALDQYSAAFELAQHDPGIEQIVRELKRELTRAPGTTAVPLARDWTTADPTSVAVHAERVRADATVSVLERWLEAILTDRRSRLYGFSV